MKKATVQVQLSNKIFKSDIVKKEIDIDSKKSDLKLKVGNILTFDKLKILVNSGFSGENSLINVQNTRVRGGKYKVKGCKTSVLPDNSIEYVCEVKGRASFNFEFEIFIIILILSYLLSYKLIDYLADFKTIKEKSRIEIIFLAIFFVCLYLPMSNIDTSDISKSENRKLAKWQPLITKDNKINYNFGKSFDNWYNDRFLGRDYLVRMYNEILYICSNKFYENERLIFNKNYNFTFSKSYNSVNRYLNKDLFSSKQLEIIRKNLVELNKYCDNNNVKLYVVLSADKESIYPEFYPKYYIRHNKKSRLEQLQDTISSIQGLKFISTKQPLLEAKNKEQVFLNLDTHLNPFGAYNEYKAVILKINELFQDIFPINYSEISNINTYAKCDSIPPKFNIDERIKYVEVPGIKNNKSEIISNLTNDKYRYVKYQNNYVKNDLNVVIIGDSFHLRYLDILAEQFKYVSSVFIGHNWIFNLEDSLKKDLFNKKPDILIIETTERGLHRFLFLDSFMNIFDYSQN